MNWFPLAPSVASLTVATLLAIWALGCKGDRDRAVPQAPFDRGGANDGVASQDHSVGGSADPSAMKVVPQVPTLPPCYGDLRASGDAKQDLRELIARCGPVNGMEATRSELMVRITPGVESALELEIGTECVRVAAAASTGVEDLELELFDGEHRSMGLANLGRSWSLLPPDRPICLSGEEAYTVKVRARGGEGLVLLQAMKFVRPEGDHELGSSDPRPGPSSGP